jgi:hypothetical protein
MQRCGPSASSSSARQTLHLCRRRRRRRRIVGRRHVIYLASIWPSGSLALDSGPQPLLRRFIRQLSSPHLHGLAPSVRAAGRRHGAAQGAAAPPDSSRSRLLTRLALNAEPAFLIGTLDQGFFPDGVYR